MAPIRTTIRDLKNQIGQTVELRGWVYNLRSSGKLRFLQMRDGSGVVQVVWFKGSVDEESFNKLDTLTQETSLIVVGKVKAEPRGEGGVELDGQSLNIIQVAIDYPIGPKEHGPDFLLSHRHLWLRSRKPHAILRIRDRFIKAVRDFFDHEGFTLVDTPIFTPAACEGTTTLFETEYFGQKAYLSQSGQLYGEATAMAFGKTYCFGPTFRAEKSKTRRHLTEFWMIEPEVAFNDLNDNMVLAERFLEYCVQYVLKECANEFKILERDTTKLQNVKAPFPRISYDEAIKRLNEAGIACEWGTDFGAPEETALAEQFDKPVFVHRFPAQIKAFYMKSDPANPKLALGMDCLAPEGYGEIIGGGQREESIEVLQSRIKEHGLKEENFAWYLDLRRYGSVPHSGFGLGLERTLSWICGLEHLREASPFPRMMYRIYP
ncbi:MAG: asparagine--tRNA ligase [Proteobacteria bacterium]|nr:asparagine--tRNA ligase [Pseudomonadota bacterium]NDC23888.1 asparagine--tRNA ligase [Pseudomonadota bacterium]NDG26549.1 asparagine--tRNA ligase [Pseudomonadota bacterium]